MRSLGRFALAGVLLGAAGALPSGAAPVERHALGRGDSQSYLCALAVGADGVLHRVFRDVDARLKHSWLEDRRWRTELVDPAEALLRDDDLAVDSRGRVHVAYYRVHPADSGLPRVAVVHGVREEGGWVLTTLALPSILSGTALAVGPDDEPRVAWTRFGGGEGGHTGPATIATRDGEDWDLEETGFDGNPYFLRVDPAGRSHLLVGGSGPPLYVTDASGSFVGEDLPGAMDGAVLTLDSSGRPHVMGEVLEGGLATLRHYVRESGGWIEGAPFGDEGTPNPRSDLRAALDPSGRPFAVYGEQVFGDRDWRAEKWLGYPDGASFRRFRLATRRGAAEISATAMGPDGVLHVLCGGREAPRVDYFRIALPDLEVDASGLSVAPAEGGATVSGTLVVRNAGAGRSEGTTLILARSADGAYGAGDGQLGRARRLRALDPGEEVSIPVSLAVAGPLAGERVLAAVDPFRRLEDLDRPDNTASVAVGE